jgi:integrase
MVKSVSLLTKADNLKILVVQLVANVRSSGQNFGQIGLKCLSIAQVLDLDRYFVPWLYYAYNYRNLNCRLMQDLSRRKSQPSGAMSARMAEVLAKARAYQNKADAEATRKAYASDYPQFESWCRRHGFDPMPPSPDTVGAYLASCGEGYALTTLRRRVAALAYTCRSNAYELTTRANAIRGTIRGIVSAHGEPGRRAAALTTDAIRAFCAVCDDSLTALRDRALLLVGFAGALRRSELVGLDVEHITWTREGTVLFIPRSKTDKEAEGWDIAIAEGANEETCPVRALRRWLKAARITSGPIFREVGRGARVQPGRLTTSAVPLLLLKCAGKAGIKGTRREPISPRGLRAGFVTTAYGNGVLDEKIMEHARHKDLKTMRGYIRRAALGGESPAGKLGL